jgi:hypothetical protein
MISFFAPGNAQNVKHLATPNAAIVSSPLVLYSSEWGKAQYLACNTAKNALFLSKTEKELIYILNLLRCNPKLFAQTVLPKYAVENNMGTTPASGNYQSLKDTLLVMPELNLLKPDKKCYISAFCHASSTGAAGLTGHDRKNDDCLEKRFFNGECIDYGYSDALAILMHLMIDEGVPSLGHRYICISRYNKIGVSIQPHIAYRHCAVLDFHY